MMANDDARVLVFTYKEGLLARLAHDLQLSCEVFEVVLDAGKLNARFALDSLKVDGAIEHGQLRASVLSASDRAKIEQTMRTEVLETRRFGEAIFAGTAQHDEQRGWIEGELALHGRTIALPRVGLTRRDQRWLVDVTFAPSQWGIVPYRALAGALKLQDRVTVRLELAAPNAEATSMRWAHKPG